MEVACSDFPPFFSVSRLDSSFNTPKSIATVLPIFLSMDGRRFIVEAMALGVFASVVFSGPLY